MADVRSLLRNERASRRIQHPHVTYSSSGSPVCLVCKTQLKSESLWESHTKSQQHLMGLQRIRDGTDPDPTVAVSVGKKRKASDDGGTLKKRTRSDGLPEGFFDEGMEISEPVVTPAVPQEIQIPSRPATPMQPKPIEILPTKTQDVDEDEWAAFEADIAAAEVPVVEDAVISAPAMTTAELAAQAERETNAQRKQKREAELEGDKEDAARKLEDEFEEMEGLEARVRRLREKREALRQKETHNGAEISVAHPPPVSENVVAPAKEEDDDDDEDDDEDDDDWDSFRLRA
ncbi:hypothetical protein BP5796_03725 [Coleophoma crateriformis]|uniref:C2H2-type domain-containing protein n=1 Tax=Coleophoma crateriformis TaxID=565419 RepID=A0A3D8SGE2_9HELO|nr:hypothetical protein BP5796_03725 [Coleophoma crateriformis]